MYHLWYQWVPLYFVLSAVVFHAPFYITKMSLIGRLSDFVEILEDPVYLLGSGGSALRLGAMLAQWSEINLNTRYGRNRMVQFAIPGVELLTQLVYLVVSVVHFWVSAKMFPIGDFYRLGLLWHVPESDSYTHIGDVLFPKMAGCIVKRWGVTGLERDSGMCVLAPNVVFQYLFLVSWWCTAVTLVLNLLNLAKTLALLLITTCCCSLTSANLEISYDRKCGGGGEPSDPLDQYTGPTKKDTKLVFSYFDLSGQLILRKLSDNVHPAIMGLGVKLLAGRVREEMEKKPEMKKWILEDMMGDKRDVQRPVLRAPKRVRYNMDSTDIADSNV